MNLHPGWFKNKSDERLQIFSIFRNGHEDENMNEKLHHGKILRGLFRMNIQSGSGQSVVDQLSSKVQSLEL